VLTGKPIFVLALGCLLAGIAHGQCDIKVTKVYTMDLSWKPGAAASGAPALGIEATFNVTGVPKSKVKVRMSIGPLNYVWNDITLTAGNGYRWGVFFDSSMLGPVPVTFSIDAEGVSGDTNPANNSMTVDVTPQYPSHGVEFGDPVTVDGRDEIGATFVKNSGTVDWIDSLFSEPCVSATQGPTAVYTPPSGAKRYITQPNGIPVQRVLLRNINTARTSEFRINQSYQTVLRNSRVNPVIMRTVPWEAIDFPLPDDVAVWRRSEISVPTDAPEIADIVGKALPSDYRTTLFPWDAAQRIFLRCAASMKYNESRDPSPLACYRNGRGACGDFAWLFVVSMRKIGFAARIAAGYYLGENRHHVWAEFYMPTIGWVPADPTDSNAIDPTGQYAYHFGTINNLNTRVSKSFGGDLTWPGRTENVGFVQVPWWFWSGGASTSATWSTVQLAPTNSLTVVPGQSTMVANSVGWATISLKQPASTEQVFNLTSSNPTVKIPPTATISAGQDHTWFPVSIGPLQSDGTAQLKAMDKQGKSASGSLNLLRRSVSVAVMPRWIPADGIPTVTASLNEPVNEPTVINLASNISGWGLPTQVTIPAGAQKVSISVPLPVSKQSTSLRVQGSVGGSTDADSALTPSRPVGIFPEAYSVKGGSDLNVTIQLATAAAAPISVKVKSGNRVFVFPAATVTIPKGVTTVQVKVKVAKVSRALTTVLSCSSRFGAASASVEAIP